jgi:hypothetical protein
LNLEDDSGGKFGRISEGLKARSNFLEDEKDDLLAGSHNILNRRKNYFCQLLNVHRFSDVRQITNTCN